MIRHSRFATTRVLTVSVVLGVFALSLSGCVQKLSTSLPAGVTIDVYQSRIDYSEHKLEIAIANNTKTPFEVLALSFSTPIFTPAVAYHRAPTIVRAGTTTDFRLLLPPADCTETSATPRVALKYSFNGATGEATVIPNDRMNQLPTIAADDCRRGEVAAISDIEPASRLRFTTVNGARAAVLDFTATPTGAGGMLTIDHVQRTTLLAIWDPVSGTSELTVPVSVDAGGAVEPVTFSITLLPARCDPHVILEDKRGTIFGFTVTTQRDTGQIFLGVSDELRGQIYDFVAESCALG